MQSIFIYARLWIIVGMPLHERKIPYNRHNRLSRKFRVVEIEKET